MIFPLPGAPLRLLGYHLEEPYSIREDERNLYLCFGSEDVVRVFDHSVTVDAVELSLRIHKAERCLADLIVGMPR